MTEIQCERVAPASTATAKSRTRASRPAEVLIAVSNAPTEAEKHARALAEYLGARVRFAQIFTARPGAPRDECLILSADTLAQIASGPAGVGGVRALLEPARAVFIFGFRALPLHSKLVEEVSGGSLRSVEPLAGGGSMLTVTENSQSWCGPLAGLEFGPLQGGDAAAFTSGEQPAEVLIHAGRRPWLVRIAKGTTQLFLTCATDCADLGQLVSPEAQVTDWFAELVPLTVFLRASLGDALWHNPHPRACFIVDDARLSQRYGFLNFSRLAAATRDLKFALSIAFVPWNFRRSHRMTALLFSSSARRFSLCVHGCEHTHGEFLTQDSELLAAQSELALAWMKAHEQWSGVPFDPVMVFPQGLFSSQALRALQASGYLAAVNTALCAAAVEPSSLRLRDLLEVAVTRYSNFPLFGRRYPHSVADFGLDLFFGKPAIIAEHHGYFRNGYAPLRRFVQQLNALETQLEWTNLAHLCSRSCVVRNLGEGKTKVRFFTDVFAFTNDTGKRREYVLSRRYEPIEAEPKATVNGRPYRLQRAGEEMEIRLTLEDGATTQIDLRGTVPACASPARPTRLHRVRVWARRMLSELRDNQLDTTPLLSTLVGLAYRMIHKAQLAAGGAAD